MPLKNVSIVKKKPYPEIREIEKSFQITEDAELCLAIGGDGTFLEATKRFDCPILHIRSEEKKSLGFRADSTLSNIKNVIEELKQEKYFVERYSKLRLTYRDKPYDAVNDVVLFRATGRTIHFKINYYDERGEGCPLYPRDVRGDGVIFARQIGSTAYNYFAHGPVLFNLDAITVTPVAANHAFSIVSNLDFHITVTKRDGVLEYDGINIAKLHVGDSFTVTKSDKVVKVVRLTKRELFSEKLARLKDF